MAHASERIYLSPPDMGEQEKELLLDAFESGWVAPLGPHVDAFEEEIAAKVGVNHAVALSSGTAALHLALQLLDIKPGDEVLTASLTFAATANAIRYCGAKPIFVDSTSSSWNIDPNLLVNFLAQRAQRHQLPKALVSVDLYGQCADYTALHDIAGRYDIPIIEDAAEALGARYREDAAGSFGTLGIFSFNGNKIITTSGGGMLVTNNAQWADRARFLATQAREPALHYEHREVGYNYRLSNLLAAVGRAQLQRLDDIVKRRRAINAMYREALNDLPGLSFMPEAADCFSTFWLSCLTVNPQQAGTDRNAICQALAAHNIEARPVWKPMHLQPVNEDCEAVGGEVSQTLFEQGLCLPSGQRLSDAQIQTITGIIQGCWS